MTDCRYLESKFIGDIKTHINKALPNLLGSFVNFKPSTDLEDTTLSFDMVYNLSFTVSVRIRKHEYIKFKDLTIRSRSKYGQRCEIDKIKEGMSQVYFYAYMNKEETELIKIRIANVDAKRRLIDSGYYQKKKNTDGTEFYTFSFYDIYNEGGAIYRYDKL